MQTTVIVGIARALDARARCLKSTTPVIDANGIDRTREHWQGMARRQEDTIAQIAREYLPSGSGIDSGSSVDVDASRADRIVLHTSFHHMDAHGGYAGWTEHAIVVRPSLAFGFTVDVRGRDRNGIKDYLAETFAHALTQTIAVDARDHGGPHWTELDKAQRDREAQA